MVTPSARAKDGDIVAARLGDEATVKTLTHRGATIVLEPANEADRAIEVGPTRRLRDSRCRVRRVPSVLGAGAAADHSRSMDAAAELIVTGTIGVGFAAALSFSASLRSAILPLANALDRGAEVVFAQSLSSAM